MGGVSSIDGEWESICKMLSIDQDPDFIDLLGDISYDDQNSRLSPTWNNDLSQSSCNGSRDQMSSISPLSSPDLLVEPQVQDKVPLRKKRTRVSKDIISKGKRKTKKSRNKVVQEEEESLNGYMSDESNDEEYSKEALKSNIGKKRASQGAAIDPQSLYARKRRERINERLRILQTLVPNGTKVDISTMLEEAVHYVKFMQMQIKMLSSEDMWMYAPLAFNGFDVGLYNNLSPYPLA